MGVTSWLINYEVFHKETVSGGVPAGTLIPIRGTAGNDGYITDVELGGLAGDYDGKSIMLWTQYGISQNEVLARDDGNNRFNSAEIKSGYEILILIY